MWIFYSFLTASLETVRDLLGKKTAQQTDEYVTAFGLQFFAALLLGLITIVVAFTTGLPAIKPVFWWALCGAIITVPVGNILYMRAVKLSPISLVVPMLAFNPLFTALVSLFFHQSLPSTWGWIGVVVVGIGLYILRLDKAVLKQGLLTPLSRVTRDPGAVAMLGVALVWSVGANLSKAMVVNASPLISAASTAIVGSVMLWLIISVRHKFHLSKLVAQVRRNLSQLSILGFAIALSNLAMSAAMSTGVTSYVIAIKRSNMVLSSLASRLFFQEKLTWIKILGILLMFTGLVMMILMRH